MLQLLSLAPQKTLDVNRKLDLLYLPVPRLEQPLNFMSELSCSRKLAVT